MTTAERSLQRRAALAIVMAEKLRTGRDEARWLAKLYEAKADEYRVDARRFRAERRWVDAERAERAAQYMAGWAAQWWGRC